MFQFTTKDGVDVNLGDIVYVLDIKRKVNKLGSIYISRDKRDVTIYEMNVTGCHAVLNYSEQADNPHSSYAKGCAWDMSGPKPTSIGSGVNRFHFDIHATSFNTFSTVEDARKALPEFLQRGIVTYFHMGMFFDDFQRRTSKGCDICE